jgi:hypothetical protein
VQTHYVACVEREAELREQIDAAQDIAALRAVDTEAGWPA